MLVPPPLLSVCVYIDRDTRAEDARAYFVERRENLKVEHFFVGGRLPRQRRSRS
jgi:hypothetical protein